MRKGETEKGGGRKHRAAHKEKRDAQAVPRRSGLARESSFFLSQLEVNRSVTDNGGTS